MSDRKDSKHRRVLHLALAGVVAVGSWGLRRTVASAQPARPTTASAQPTRHALLVGVGAFADKTIRTLDGPPFDVAALQRELVQRWNFAPERVQTLVNAQATKANILAALDGLIERSKPGDIVLFYFSGHGTSRQDQNLMLYDLHPATGALFPYDVVKSSDAEIIQSLIVGRRDLRQRFDRLDDGRQVLIVIDSCYSRNATRSFGLPRGAPKSEPLSPKAQPLLGQLQGFASTAAPEPYPYKNIVSLLAASEAEQARDISFADIKENGIDTVDHQPKGALTDALLRGLRGEANTDSNRVLTLNELFRYAREEVKQRFNHSPQLVLPEGRADIGDAPMFGSRSAPVRPVTTVRPFAGLRVSAENVAPRLRQRLLALDGVHLSTDAFDVRLVVSGTSIQLYHESGDLLEEFPATAETPIVERVKRQVWANSLVTFAFPNQEFNVRVDIPTRTGVLKAGTSHTVSFSADVEAHFLVLNIDKEGMVGVLAPLRKEELGLKRSGAIDKVGVTAPEGTEFVKVFAFKRAPTWLARWTDGSFIPADSPEMMQLLSSLRGIQSGAAETRLKFVTVR